MALQSIPVVGADGSTYKVFADLHDTDRYSQVTKLGFGADDASPTLVAAAAGLPVRLYDAAGNPLVVADDSAFTAGTSPVLPVGYVADETATDSVDEGDVGAPRMSLNRIPLSIPRLFDGTTQGAEPARAIGGVSATAPNTGVQAVAGSSFSLQLSSGTPAPTGTDILDDGGSAIVGGDLDIRDTNNHYFVIPMSGWGRIRIGFGVTSHDQAVSLTVFQAQGFISARSQLLAVTIPASTVLQFGISDGATGQGGTTGGATAANFAHYNVPGLNGGGGFIAVLLAAAVAPSNGAITMYITRSRF